MLLYCVHVRVSPVSPPHNHRWIGHGGRRHPTRDPYARKANMHGHTQDVHMDMARYHIPQPHCGGATATTNHTVAAPLPLLPLLVVPLLPLLPLLFVRSLPLLPVTSKRMVSAPYATRSSPEPSGTRPAARSGRRCSHGLVSRARAVGRARHGTAAADRQIASQNVWNKAGIICKIEHCSKVHSCSWWRSKPEHLHTQPEYHPWVPVAAMAVGPRRPWRLQVYQQLSGHHCHHLQPSRRVRAAVSCLQWTFSRNLRT